MAAHRYWRLYIAAQNGYQAGTSNYCSAAEVELRASIGGADETGSGTASSSGDLNATQAVAKAFDNSTATYWFSSAGTLPKFIKYDFGAGTPKDIVEVAYTVPNNETRSAITDWQLQYSDDNASWSTLFRVQDSAHSSLGQKVYNANDYAELGAAANQAWRLLVTAVNGGTIAQITELQMFVSGSAADQCTGGKGYASTTFDGTVSPANAFDGVLAGSASMWASRNAANEWLAYRFAAAKAITTIGITNPPATVTNYATQAPKDFSLQYWDGAAWQTAWSVAGITGWGSNQTRYFDATGETTAPVAAAARPVVFVAT